MKFAKLNPREKSNLRFAKLNPRENLSSRKLILAKINPNKVNRYLKLVEINHFSNTYSSGKKLLQNFNPPLLDIRNLQKHDSRKNTEI